jgi:membrane protein implicated in regulation of membrane protease activity
MTWADFYLVCFLVGLTLSVLSLVLGHLNLHVHLPHGDFHGFDMHLGDAGAAHGGMPMHDAGMAHVHTGDAHAVVGDAQISPINFATVTAFLAWFGGAGFLLTHYGSFWYLLGFLMSVAVGLAGGWIVLWILRKLITKEENMDPADYEMVGVLGRVVSGIRAGGTGEIVFVQGGTRQTAGARSEDGSAIGREEEVVVTRYEKGIAYVRRWDELAAEDTLRNSTL